MLTSRNGCVFVDTPSDLIEKFDKIDIFIWRWRFDQAGMLDLLPPISTLIVQNDADFEVNFDLKYEMPTVSTGATQLEHFTFGFWRDDIPELKQKSSGEIETDDLSIVETNRAGETTEIWLTVTVLQNLDRRQLIKILVRFALKLTVASLQPDQPVFGPLKQ